MKKIFINLLILTLLGLFISPALTGSQTGKIYFPITIQPGTSPDPDPDPTPDPEPTPNPDPTSTPDPTPDPTSTPDPTPTPEPTPNPPGSPVKLIFIHHSTGEAWLVDNYGELGLALKNNNYAVSDTNYGWGPDSIGDLTDIGHWYEWFRSPQSPTYMSALYAFYNEPGTTAYTRIEPDPGGENEIVLFKSCFPNSWLRGSISDPIPPIASNPLKNEDAGSEHHTISNAKGIYIDLLEYFVTMPHKLFVVITAPPLTDPTFAHNARAFNNWLVNDWLNDYPLNNVKVFDFYNVLTSNGGNPNKNDLGYPTGNHHRIWEGTIQHQVGYNNNTLSYPVGDGDDHPSAAGSLKATGEFVDVLNVWYNEWKND